MRLRRPVTRYITAILAATVLAVGLTALWMQPPLADLLQLSLIYGLTALTSAVLGIVAHRVNLWRRLSSLSGSLILGYAVAAGLTLLNVWVAARLMFISQHDLALAGVLLLFASGISVSFGYLLSQSLSNSLQQISHAAGLISQGKFTERVPVHGRDEVARLSRAFNEMALRLESADAESKRLESARRDFVAWVSHDLRTPLASLRAMVDALAEGVVADEQTVGDYLSRCQSEIERLSAMIDDLFELSRLDSGHFQLGLEMCALSDLISDAVGALAPRAAQKGIEVEAHVQPSVDPVRIAPRQVTRAVHNLLDNALRHTPEGGRITVEATAQGEVVLVSVLDSGKGIPEPELDLVFERFYRGEASRRRQSSDSAGAGLGLAIARGMVEAHGGRIWAEASEAGGVFRFTLPRARLPAGEPIQ